MLNPKLYMDAITDKIGKRIDLIDAAIRNHDAKALRDHIYKALVLCRLQTQGDILVLMDVRESIRSVQHTKEKLKKQGVTTIFDRAYMERLKSLEKAMKEKMHTNGAVIFQLLDNWQELGASLEDLCHLCNNTMPRMLKQIADEPADSKFSALVFANNLDYKEKGDWLKYSADAPFTFAMQDYVLDLLTNNPEGREIVRNAIWKKL